MDEQFKRLRLDIGKLIKAKRKEIAISQEELAFQADIDRTYVSQLERGIGNPSLHILYKVAKALQLPMETLFTQR